MIRPRRALFLVALLSLTCAAALPPVRTAAAQTEPWCPACSMLPSSVPYMPNATELSDQGKGILDDMIATMKGNQALRVQLVAYASAPPEQAAQARRLALSRAISVRTYMIERGVRSTRIDVRAFGNRADAGSPDRVDIVALDQ